MVNLYEVSADGRNFVIYAPETKEESAQMILHGFPFDVWLHIDGSKYLPVYLRQHDLQPGTQLDIDEISSSAIMSCGQIVKHFANTKRDVMLKYSFLCNMSANGPLDASQTRTRTCKTKKTGSIADPQLLATERRQVIDFEAERLKYDAQQQKLNSEHFRNLQKTEKESSRQYQQLAEQKHRGYSEFFDKETMQEASNQHRNEDWEDDFM